MMNKKEVIEKIRNLEPDEQNLHEYQPEEWDAFEDGFFDAKTYAELIIEKLDELEKPVVPQFIDTWIQGAKYNGFDLYEAMTDDEIPDKVATWIVCNPETFAKAWLYGYEVEKEKLYTARLTLSFEGSSGDGDNYLNKDKKTAEQFLSTVDDFDDYQTHFTQAELEELKFWDNPAFEIKEVTE